MKPASGTDVRFAGRIAVVTGASQGIGRAIALLLASQGCRVGVHYRSNQRAAKETRDKIVEAGGMASVVQADLSQPREARRMCDEVGKELGSIDLLVNNAGRFMERLASEESPTDFLSALADNLHTTFTATWAAKDGMLERRFGRIVNIASTGAFFRTTGSGVGYGVAKAGVIALTKGWASAWGPKNLRVNCVAPGFIDTEANEKVDPAIHARVISQTPLARAGEADEVARAVAFLLSDESSFINGQTVAVCGGRVMLP